nr:FtrB [Erythrotrichia carnea]
MTNSYPLSTNLEAMRQFSEKYSKTTGTFFCSDLSVTSVVIEGLAKHKDEYGSPLCPCRHYEDKSAEVAAAYWNCPCVPMRERKECHCMLFLKPDNDFAGENQHISTETLMRHIGDEN